MSQKSENISYSAVVLTEESSNRLKEWAKETFKQEIAFDSWRLYCHHMTICMGELPAILKSDIGTSVTLNVNGYGKSNNAIAVRVDGFYTKNKIPHVTVAISPMGKPVMSNEIKNWYPINNGMKSILKLEGIVTEISR